VKAVQLAGIRKLEEILEGCKLEQSEEVLVSSGIKRREVTLKGRELVQRCVGICAFHESLMRPGAFQPVAEVREQLEALADAIDALGTDAWLHLQSYESRPGMTDLERYARGCALQHVRERAATPFYSDGRGVRRFARARFGQEAADFAKSVGIEVSATRSAEFIELLDAMVAVMDARIDAHRLARDIVAGFTEGNSTP
jgi:hypothetical protein